jgi:hypothetical protein
MKYTLIALDTFSLERDFLEFEEWEKLIEKARELESNHQLTAVIKETGQTIDLAHYLNGSLTVDPDQTSLF